MDGIINRLVDLNGGQLLFPLILCAIAVLLFKWIASNAQSKGCLLYTSPGPRD